MMDKIQKPTNTENIFEKNIYRQTGSQLSTQVSITAESNG
jgi:hypothetical protein